MSASTTIASGALTTIVGTEQTLTTATAEGAYTLKLDASALASGDVLVVRAREVVAAGGSLVLSEEQTLTGAQSPAVQTTVPLAVAAGGTLSFRVHQTAGSARVIPWAVISL